MLKCWGSNADGQLNVPAEIDQSEIKFLAAGSQHTCAADIKMLKCFGNNDQNQLIQKSLIYFTDDVQS
jgi:hypothetical protein